MQRDIRKLRIRFVIVVILIVTFVMGCIFGVICNVLQNTIEDAFLDPITKHYMIRSVRLNATFICVGGIAVFAVIGIIASKWIVKPVETSWKEQKQFVSDASHELKTPITAISGYAELLEGNMVAEDKKNHFYHEIHRNSDRLLALINDIIRLSEFDRKNGEEAFEEFDLYELAQGSMGVLGVNARQRGVEITLEGEPCKLIGNKEMIKELIENLAQNAIRYNNEGGKVLIKVDATNDKAALIVKDNGIGIPAAEQQRVFERFYRVDKSRSKATGGTGLGLAIVKHIVEIHDARIELDSAPGVGTTVSVYF